MVRILVRIFLVPVRAPEFGPKIRSGTDNPDRSGFRSGFPNWWKFKKKFGRVGILLKHPDQFPDQTELRPFGPVRNLVWILKTFINCRPFISIYQKSYHSLWFIGHCSSRCFFVIAWSLSEFLHYLFLQFISGFTFYKWNLSRFKENVKGSNILRGISFLVRTWYTLEGAENRRNAWVALGLMAYEIGNRTNTLATRYIGNNLLRLETFDQT